MGIDIPAYIQAKTRVKSTECIRCMKCVANCPEVALKIFAWSYDSQETCYILEGKVTIKTQHEEVHLGPGDLVIFPKGLSCVWDI